MRRLLLTAALLLLALPATALAEPPEGSVWTEDYIESGERSDGGPTLHADVFRPEGMADDVKTPVLLVVSPYTNHSGGPADPDPNERPSSRFNDFVEEAGLMERGYTYVIVDLRGTGGSDGCNDWGGPGEQADVREAVEWAARAGVVERPRRPLRQVLRRLDRPDGAGAAARGPRRGRLPGARRRRLPLPLHEPRAVLEPAHARRRSSRSSTRSPATRTTTRVPRHVAAEGPLLLRRPTSPTSRTPTRVGLLEVAQPRRRGQGRARRRRS